MIKKILFSLSLLFCFNSFDLYSDNNKDTIIEKKKTTTEKIFEIAQLTTSFMFLIIITYMQHRMKTISFNIINNVETKFSDVAGIDEAIASVKRLVSNIKDPAASKELGAKLPKGILLHGPPGTGKTLLARALAGEANCSFIAISSTELFSKWIGQSEANIRALFSTARWEAWWTGKPCIIFIDEFDSLARNRNYSRSFEANIFNQLLTEMDGFTSKSDNIIVIAATNKLDHLDPAVLRPGRFDEQIYVGTPDVQGRANILKIHIKNIKHSGMDEENIMKMAFATPGFSGAQLANLVNRAAIIATKKGLKAVTIEEFQDARDQIIVGERNETKFISEKERIVIAYHEAGHALMLLLAPEMNLELHQVTICPRGNALGLTTYLPRYESLITSKEDMLHQVMLCLGGRAAEELVFGLISTGASGDFNEATNIVKSMISDYGMTEEFGMVARKKDRGSEKVNDLIKKIIDEMYLKVMNLLRLNRDKLDLLVQALLKKDTLNAEEVYELLGITPPSKNQQDFVLAQAA